MALEHWKRTILGPGLTIEDWEALRVHLDPAALDAGWERAIAAIERRFSERFIGPATALLELDASDGRAIPEGRGFAILALDCLLVETRHGYRRGRRTRIGETSAAFETFLDNEPAFRDDPGLAQRISSFARAVRNGILHDGETRDGWIVWKRGGEGLLAQPLSDGRVVLYRDAFHAAVTAAFARYFAELRAHGPEAVRLRLKFRDRVDQLSAESAPPEPGQEETRALPWQTELLPRWSLDQLTVRDDRIKHFTPDGLALGMALSEKGSWRYVQTIIASCELSSDVPDEVRRRAEAVQLLHVYGYFQSDFFDLVHGEAAAAQELALRCRFMREHPTSVTLRNLKNDRVAVLALTSYDTLADALRPRGPNPARDGWRLDGSLDFDGSLRGLYLWARERGLLTAFLSPIWERARPGIEVAQLEPAEDRGLPKTPDDFDSWSPEARERWWEETYRPAWEVSYLENEVDIRNVLAHPGGGFNRMPNYSAASVRRLFDFVNALFAPPTG